LPRVKRGVPAHQRHKKIIDISKGARGTSSKLFRRANESMLHALSYATRDRRDRKREMRKLWIIRINAGARENGLSYSHLVQGLRLAGVTINRKVLADLAITDPQAFAKIVETARQATAAQTASA
jgi:large subunit ribosomal protein L20